MGTTRLTLVRHGESAGNVAAAAAIAAGAEVIDVPARDPDVDLSLLGVAQAEAVGTWLAGLPAADTPDAVWSSTYRRAVRTAEHALAAAGLDLPVHQDERLRDRELGVLDTLTAVGVAARLPGEAARRAWLGKFAHRPPGGESWADVALRLRSFLADLDRYDEGEHLLVVAHDAPILLLRYVCEGLTEEQVLGLGGLAAVRNGSVTRLERDPGARRWRLVEFAATAHLDQLGVPATVHGGTVDA